MWIDGEANFARFSNPDSIDYYVTKLKSLGFTDLVVDIRPITGEVFYESAYAPRMLDWQGAKRSKDLDYLGRFIKKGHVHHTKRGRGGAACLGRTQSSYPERDHTGKSGR